MPGTRRQDETESDALAGGRCATPGYGHRRRGYGSAGAIGRADTSPAAEATQVAPADDDPGGGNADANEVVGADTEDESSADIDEAGDADTIDSEHQADGADVEDASAAEAADNGGEESDTPPAGTPAIGEDAARQAAASELKVDVTAVTAIELEQENGRLVYGVEIGASDVKVDANTGAVLGVESDSD